MTDISWVLIAILSAISFLAGFIDSIAGGGGAILVPSLMLAGIPPHSVLGTNKFASAIGTGTAVLNFARKKMVWWPLISFGIVFTLFGSFLGSKAILSVNPDLTNKIMVGLFPMAMAAMLWRRPKATPSSETTPPLPALSQQAWKVILVCTTIGFYDGFFGPGAGTFFAIAMYLFLELKLIQATANAKVFNLLSNISALVVFIINGKVLWHVGIPLAIANVAGNWVGSHMAMKKGDQFIQKILLMVLLVLMANLIWKFFFE